MRKTSKEYTKELTDLRERTLALESRIKNRLLKMVDTFPEAIVERKDGVDMKARSLTKSWVDSASTEVQLKYIGAIEQYNLEAEMFYQSSWV